MCSATALSTEDFVGFGRGYLMNLVKPRIFLLEIVLNPVKSNVLILIHLLWKYGLFTVYHSNSVRSGWQERSRTNVHQISATCCS